MFLEILTPAKRVFEGEVDAVLLPGSEERGPFEVRAHHAAIISSLKAGVLKITAGKEETTYHVESGFVEVNDNKIAVTVEGIQK